MTVRFFRLKIKKAYATALALLIVVPVLVITFSGSLYALELLNRSIRVNTSTPSATTTHNFGFDYRSSDSVGSVVFEYCSNSPLFMEPCTAPAGLDVSALSIALQTGEVGFSIDGSTSANRIVLTRIAAPVSPQSANYNFNDIINPSTARQSVYVRISTHGSIDGTGSRIDEGAVVFSTSGVVSTTLFVPPYLTFCVGLSVALDCSSLSGTGLDMGVFSTLAANTSSSQFAAATNDPFGYTVAITGLTMTSGNNVIPAMNVPGVSIAGVSQFGINLRANNAPSVGQNPSGAGSGGAVGNYNIQNVFKFTSGDVIARSLLPTEFNRYTVSYLVNVSEDQAPGVYAATFTYIATAAF